MTATQKIKREILRSLGYWDDANPPHNVDAAYGDAYEESDDQLCEAESEFRGGEVETDVPSPNSRHYESRSVAAKMSDGSWVGWTYWYGGGKHGDPGSIEWMDDAYDLDVKEEEKLVVVRTFTKREGTS